MSDANEQKKQYIHQICQNSPYTYYILCRGCGKVNVPDPPGLCSSCLRKTEHVRDNYRPKPTANRRTKKAANKCGALPWVYRGKRDDHEMCHLTYGKYFISVRRQKDRRFCYIVGSKQETSLRENIPELTFARTRAVRHLAKILGMEFYELCERIKNESK